MWIRGSWVRVPLPTPEEEGLGENPNPFFLYYARLVHRILGCSQAVRHGTLTPAFVGSSPTIPARARQPEAGSVWAAYDPLAQSAEQLPFKQWVRGSNPRRVTKPGVLDLQELRGFSLCFQCFLGFLHVLNALVKNNLCWQKSVNLQMNLQMKTLTFPIWKERRFFFSWVWPV